MVIVELLCSGVDPCIRDGTGRTARASYQGIADPLAPFALSRETDDRPRQENLRDGFQSPCTLSSCRLQPERCDRRICANSPLNGKNATAAIAHERPFTLYSCLGRSCVRVAGVWCPFRFNQQYMNFFRRDWAMLNALRHDKWHS